MRKKRFDEVAARRKQRQLEQDLRKLEELSIVRDYIQASPYFSQSEKESLVLGLCEGMSQFLPLERLDQVDAWHNDKCDA